MGLMDSLKAALKGATASTLPPPPDLPPPPARELGHLMLNDEISVVGTSNYQDALKRISQWNKNDGPVERYHNAVVEFEPTNPYDSKAIKVTVDGLLVGYIAKSDHRYMTPKVSKAGGAVIIEMVIIGGQDKKYLGAYLR